MKEYMAIGIWRASWNFVADTPIFVLWSCVNRDMNPWPGRPVSPVLHAILSFEWIIIHARGRMTEQEGLQVMKAYSLWSTACSQRFRVF